MAPPTPTSTLRPDDFDPFWEGVLAAADRLPLNATMERLPLRSDPKVDVYEVHYDSLDGIRIAGWYCLPTRRHGPLPALLQLPGYLQDPPIPKAAARDGYATFGAAPRGKLRSRAQFDPGYPGLLTDNITDRNTYTYRGFYIDAVRAFDFLRSRPEVRPDRIGLTGSSQGGGLTIAVAGLRGEQVRAASAGAPYLCGFMDAIRLTRTYPYQEIGDYLRTFPDSADAVRDTLGYFDGICFGPRISCPIIVNLGLQDNICPPETGYSLFDAIGSPDKKLYPYDGCGHDAGRALHDRVVDAFFATHLKEEGEENGA